MFVFATSASHFAVSDWMKRAKSAGETRAADLVRAAGHPSVTFVEQKDTLVDQVLPHLKSGDLVITLGAGDIWKTGLGLLVRLTPTA